MLRPARFEDGQVRLTVLRPDATAAQSVSVLAHGRDPSGAERVLARAAIQPHRRSERRAQILLDGIGRREERRGQGRHDDEADDEGPGAGQRASPDQPG